MSFGAHLYAKVVPLSNKLPRRRSGQSIALAHPARHQNQAAAPVPPAWGCSAAGAWTALTSAHAGASEAQQLGEMHAHTPQWVAGTFLLV